MTPAKTLSSEEIERRVDEAIRKYDAGEKLSDYEWLLYQHAMGGQCTKCRHFAGRRDQGGRP